MALKTITGIAFPEASKGLVPGLLCQDRRRCDRRQAAITLGHGDQRTGRLARRLGPIDQGQAWRQGETSQGPSHGQQAGLENIQLINFPGLSAAKGPGQGAAADFLRKHRTTRWREGF